MQRFISLLIFLVTSLFFSLPVHSQDITLSWDASPTSGVTGYNVYYKTGDMSFPFDGTGADQGNSPVNVGDVLSTNLTGLPDGRTFFFTVTAYDDNSNQSTYSNIVSNDWIPALLIPQNGVSNEPVPAMLQWQTAPSGYNVTYTLFYGNDQNEVSNAIIPPAGWSFNHGPAVPELIYLLFFIFLLSSVLLLKNRFNFKPQMLTAGLILFIGGALAACGGGGGGSESSGDKTVTPVPAPVDSILYSVDKGTSDYHEAIDLEAGTTYYWKVVATDINDSNLKYESQVQSFTTEVF